MWEVGVYKDQIIVTDTFDEDAEFPRVAFFPLTREGVQEIERLFGGEIDPADLAWLYKEVQHVRG